MHDDNSLEQFGDDEDVDNESIETSQEGVGLGEVMQDDGEEEEEEEESIGVYGQEILGMIRHLADADSTRQVFPLHTCQAVALATSPHLQAHLLTEILSVPPRAKR